MTIYELAKATHRKVVRLYSKNLMQGWDTQYIPMVTLKGGMVGRISMLQSVAIQMMSQEVEAQ